MTNKTEPTTVTRDQLYQQVWSTPMERLAQEYGVSGRGLAKICDRLKVPYPPRGWWAKKAAGIKVIQYRLPSPQQNTPLEVTISPSPVPESPDPRIAEVRQAIESEKIQKITVPERLSKPHPVIANLIKEHEQRRTDARRNGWNVPPNFTETDRRKHRILDALLKAMEREGISAKTDKVGKIYFEIRREKIEFALREKLKQVRVPLSPDNSMYSERRPWTQELHGTGTLLLVINTYLPRGFTREWKDRADQPLEKQLSDIVAVLVSVIPALEEERRLKDEQERIRLEKERIEYEEKERRKLDRNRVLRFLEIADWHDSVNQAREFLRKFEQRVDVEAWGIDGKPLSEWVTLLRETLDRQDPLLNAPEAIFAKVACVTSWSYRDE